MKTSIGAYEAKTKLPELLRQVEAGSQFTITNRGKAVADLVPTKTAAPKDKTAAVETFKAFMQANPMPKRKPADIKQLIEDGRA